MRGCFGAGTRYFSVCGCTSNGFFRTSISRLICAATSVDKSAAFTAKPWKLWGQSWAQTYQQFLTIAIRQVSYMQLGQGV